MEYLNESSVADLLKIIDAFGQLLKTTPEDGKFGKAKAILKNSAGPRSQYKGSISSQANKLVMTFPVLCSNTISYPTASMLSKAIERKCTLMLQQLFAADILVAGANSGGIQHQINNIYTGIDFDTLTVDDMVNLTNTITAKQGKAFFEHAYLMEVAELAKKKVNAPVYESSVNESPLSLYMLNESGKATVDPEMVLTEAKKVKRSYNFDPSSIRSVNGVSGNSIYDVLKANKLDDIITDRIAVDIRAAGSLKDMDDALNVAANLNRDSRENAETKRRIANDIENLKVKIEELKQGDAGLELNRRKINAEIEKNEKDLKERIKQNKISNKFKKEELKLQQKQAKQAELIARQDYFKKQLMDTDVKKANELVPSMLVVNYAVEGDKGEMIQSSAIVGIKTRLISLDSFEILDKITQKNKDKSGFVKLIRATTGEIRFLKDFVLAVDKAKIDALNKSKRGSANPIWRVLERRAAVNNLRKALGQKNDASPITTLIVTQEEVDYLRKTAGMDLDNVNTANYILNAFNLMGICIVDEAAEVAKFLFDGEFGQFDVYSFGSLEKESGDSGMYKKIINLMSKRM